MNVFTNILYIVALIVVLIGLYFCYWWIFTTDSELPLEKSNKGRLGKALLFLIIFTPIITLCFSSCSLLRNIYEKIFIYSEGANPNNFLGKIIYYLIYGLPYLETRIPRIEFLGEFYINLDNIVLIIIAEIVKIVLIIIYNAIIVKILNLKKVWKEVSDELWRAEKEREKTAAKEYLFYYDYAKKSYVFKEDKFVPSATKSLGRIIPFYVCFTVLPLVSSVIFIGEFIIKNIIAAVKSK